jgi:YegS/Rv2252/BmrU family lipid kinase
VKKATLVYNPVAGRHPARREKQMREAAAVLRDSGISARLVRTSGPDTAIELARRAVSQGDDLLLVCGGDGTINEVVNGMTPGNLALGILPGGTANIAGRELGLPLDPVRAARQLPAWSSRRIALGLVTWPAAALANAPVVQGGRRYFLSVAGLGFDAYAIHKLSVDFKRSCGAAAYFWEGLRQTFRYTFPRFVCEIDGRKHNGTFAVVLRANRYGGWLRMAPNANIFEPRFSLCLFKSRHRARYFLYAAAVLIRQHLRLRDVDLVEAQEIGCTAEGETPIYFELDGELVGRLPAKLEIVPDALTLLVP